VCIAAIAAALGVPAVSSATIERVVAPVGEGGLSPAISGDGRYVAYTGFIGMASYFWVRDRTTGTTERIAPGGGYGAVSISGDGRFVAFEGSSALGPGSPTRTTDILVRDRATGASERVSVAGDGSAGNGTSGEPSISADGRFVAFSSFASNLVPGDTNAFVDIFVHDRVTGTTERADVTSTGAQTEGASYPALSDDGRVVAFASRDQDGNGIFVHDRTTGITQRASITSTGRAVTGWDASISADGRFLAFTNPEGIYVRDRVTRTTELLTGRAQNPSISADGRYVAFASALTTLVPGDSNQTADVFVRDRLAGTTERVNVALADGQANSWSYNPSISADGRVVAFESTASDLVPGDTNNTSDVFVSDRRDRAAPVTARMELLATRASLLALRPSLARATDRGWLDRAVTSLDWALAPAGWQSDDRLGPDAGLATLNALRLTAGRLAWSSPSLRAATEPQRTSIIQTMRALAANRFWDHWSWAATTTAEWRAERRLRLGDETRDRVGATLHYIAAWVTAGQPF
jgi:Tol biopolymer transport system component